MLLAHHEVGLVWLLLALPGGVACLWAWINGRRHAKHHHHGDGAEPHTHEDPHG